MYLPYNDHLADSMESYLECLDKLQCLVNDSDPNAPAVVVGDFNTRLLQSQYLVNNWYRKKPFSKRSLLLYEFLYANNLCVANFINKQNINYTYRINRVTSYIDHVMIPVHISDNVQQCDIVPETADNPSDHLPISMTLNIQTPAGKSIEKSRSNMTVFPQGKWSNDRFKGQYCAKVKAALESWKPCEIEKVTSAEAGKVINDMCNSLCKLLHSCVSQCTESVPPKKSYNESKWWNYDCYLALENEK